MNNGNINMSNQSSIFDLIGGTLPEGWNNPVNKKEESKNKCNNTTKSKKSAASVIPKKKEEDVVLVKLPTTIWIGTTPIPVGEEHFDVSDFKDPLKSLKKETVLPEHDISDELTELDDEQQEDPVGSEGSTLNKTADNIAEDIDIDFSAKYVDLETIRQFIEEKLPAYTKERTKMHYDKKKNIVMPDLFNGKLGSGLSPFSGYFYSSNLAMQSHLPINIVACKNGYYNMVNTVYGHMIVKTEVPELEIGKEGLLWSLPLKIPFLLLQQLTSFFKYVARLDDNYESMGRIYYDEICNNFFVLVPKQKTTFISVDVINEYEKYLLPSVHRVMTLHSHPTFPAVFSSTDDAYDLETGLSLVVGWTSTKDIPDFNLRMSVNGVFKTLKLDSVFSLPAVFSTDDFNVNFPNEWIENITFECRGEL